MDDGRKERRLVVVSGKMSSLIEKESVANRCSCLGARGETLRCGSWCSQWPVPVGLPLPSPFVRFKAAVLRVSLALSISSLSSLLSYKSFHSFHVWSNQSRRTWSEHVVAARIGFRSIVMVKVSSFTRIARRLKPQLISCRRKPRSTESGHRVSSGKSFLHQTFAFKLDCDAFVTTSLAARSVSNLAKMVPAKSSPLW